MGGAVANAESRFDLLASPVHFLIGGLGGQLQDEQDRRFVGQLDSAVRCRLQADVRLPVKALAILEPSLGRLCCASRSRGAPITRPRLCIRSRRRVTGISREV